MIYRTLYRSIRAHSSSAVRVRFAPSPTGQLHLGGLRTALFNYLFAKAHKGKFILRIEDTDQGRLVPESVNGIHRILEHYGLHPDESPSVGGPRGPYQQSERLSIYRENIDRLIDSGHAYRCFCSEERLELLRRDAMRNNTIPKYDGKCRRLDPREAAKRGVEGGEAHVIRFKLDKQDVNFTDQVFGDVTQTLDESDFVLVKSDGFPTYHFANIVDDHLMEVSHVIRGMEWLSSTGKHALMYRAFSWQPPKFLHLPLITRDGRKKLSKRDQDAYVDYYNEKKGYLPVTVLNFLLRNGSGIANFDSTRLYSLQELIDNFDVSTIGRRNLQLDHDSLEHYGRLAFQSAPLDTLYPLIVDRIDKELPGTEDVVKGKEYVGKVVDFLKTKEETFSSLSTITSPEFRFFFCVPSGTEKLLSHFPLPSAISLLSSLLSREGEWTIDWLKEVAKKEGVKHAKLFHLIRLSLIDHPSGPPIMELYEFFGLAECQHRLNTMLTLLQKSEKEESAA